MGGLLLCGKKAKRPFYISQIEKNIYSIEELQYYLFNNIYLISKDFFSEELITFIGVELELSGLSQKIGNLMKKKGDFKDMVMVLLSAGSYYGNEELKVFEQTLNRLDSMSLAQRLKSKADGYFESGKYNTALKAYMEILSAKNDEPDEFTSAIWNNIGAIYARLFLFKEAYSCYKVASTLYPAQKVIDRLVVSALMCEEQSVIDDLQFQFKITDEELSEYENSLDYEIKHIKTSNKFGELSAKLSYDSRKEINLYYQEIGQMIDGWKNEYRELIC